MQVRDRYRLRALDPAGGHPTDERQDGPMSSVSHSREFARIAFAPERTRRSVRPSGKAEEQAPFAGWDFSHLDGRMFEEQPPWSYEQRAGELLQSAQAASTWAPAAANACSPCTQQWPPRLFATEDYPPNVFLAAKRLTAAGAAVVVAACPAEADTLPFAGAVFDVVLNRHSAANASEVARVLAPGGIFYTQQIHGLWAADLLAVFGATPPWPDATLERKVNSLDRQPDWTSSTPKSWSGRLRFADVGAVVYYLKAVPWLVPGFSVDTHQDALLRLQARLDRGEPLVFLARKYKRKRRRP